MDEKWLLRATTLLFKGELEDDRRLNVDDVDLEPVGKLHHLEFLSVGATRVSDHGLKHLEQLHRLKELDLTDTRVTEAAVQRLSRTLPQCKIHYDATVAPNTKIRRVAKGGCLNAPLPTYYDWFSDD
jgi:hypothetical protein